MIELLEILKKRADLNPNKIIWEDEKYGKYNYRYIEDTSTYISNFLLEKEIGKEDVVVIKMSRSARIYIAMLGVWKTGAAFTIIGEHSPEDYVEYILKNTEPKYIFDDNSFDIAIKYHIKKESVITQEHDLACIIYSTGSTGIFKGCMHEYGIIDKLIRNAKMYQDEYPNDYAGCRSLNRAGFYTISSVFILIDCLYYDYYVYTVSYSDLINYDKLSQIIRNNKINTIFISVREIDWFKKQNFCEMENVSVLFDMFEGFTDSNYNIMNNYGLTESFGLLTTFFVDKKYEITPAGKPIGENKIKIVDKTGKTVENGKIGELCFYSEYFRGYKNLEKLTKITVKDNWVMTGDIGYVDDMQNYVVLGRKVDMIETKKGYIIPIIISNNINQLFYDIDKSYVKLFHKDNTVKVCVYYCGRKNHTICEFREKLKDVIPDFMMPTHCKKMIDFEYFPSGKIKRNSFEELTE